MTIMINSPAPGRELDCTFCTNVFIPLHRYWNRLEGYCRELTKRYAEVSIISGPLFLPEKDEKTGKSYVRYEVSFGSVKADISSFHCCMVMY